ncbi:GNAT family N-acetyltransferase [Litorihabitans aurantiacus]|uniref:N-acetyltransferase domain-containing protein n=1 Tax=Litorihabitans aurantiacus TaxID=1930061 RepID=A0AA38CUC2_9MICO|nr:GNAT family protein [Litorihabitans aurantiacus]GMA32664.1 hypothetical protein GCM10025875_26560 [Litorihabitans aurantiacus]
MPTPLLRPWITDDATALRSAVATSPDLVTQLPVDALGDDAACAAFITDHLATPSKYERALAIAVDGEAVGNVAIGAIDRRHGTGWISYWLAASARGRGLAARALVTVAARALDPAGDDLFRLELGHRLNNPSSCAVARRAGFVAEGVERAKLAYGSERFDVETHARLRTDPAPSTAPLEVAAAAW